MRNYFQKIIGNIFAIIHVIMNPIMIIALANGKVKKFSIFHFSKCLLEIIPVMPIVSYTEHCCRKARSFAYIDNVVTDISYLPPCCNKFADKVS